MVPINLKKLNTMGDFINNSRILSEKKTTKEIPHPDVNFTGISNQVGVIADKNVSPIKAKSGSFNLLAPLKL